MTPGRAPGGRGQVWLGASGYGSTARGPPQRMIEMATGFRFTGRGAFPGAGGRSGPLLHLSVMETNRQRTAWSLP